MSLLHLYRPTDRTHFSVTMRGLPYRNLSAVNFVCSFVCFVCGEFCFVFVSLGIWIKKKLRLGGVFIIGWYGWIFALADSDIGNSYPCFVCIVSCFLFCCFDRSLVGLHRVKVIRLVQGTSFVEFSCWLRVIICFVLLVW